MRTLLPTTALALALLAAAGCGQTGPLQLPAADAQAPVAEEPQTDDTEAAAAAAADG